MTVFLQCELQGDHFGHLHILRNNELISRQLYNINHILHNLNFSPYELYCLNSCFRV
jgi:hypothetical protein